MKTSGRVSVDTSTFTDTVSSTITTNLSPLELSLLDIFYKKMFPQYKNLCDEYEKAKTLAVNARRKSLFPGRTDWQPVCGFKDANDRLLFQGPKPVVNERKKMECEDVSTGKKYVLMSSEHEPVHTSGRHLCSIVHVLQQEPDRSTRGNHTVAYISKLFTHQFGKDEFKLALLNVYTNVKKDDDGLLWSKTDEFKTGASILPVHWLSSPLVVGFEENKIHFLNFVNI